MKKVLSIITLLIAGLIIQPAEANDVCDNIVDYGRVDSVIMEDFEACVVLDQIILKVFEDSLDVAISDVNAQPNWEVGNTLENFNIIIAAYTPDTLSIASLQKEMEMFEEMSWAEVVDYDMIVGGATSIEQLELPDEINLTQNYPNPFNPSTIIEYSIDSPQHIRLAVYDISGKEVQTLVYGTMQAGNYTINFDASDLPSGQYSIQTGNGKWY